jgi:hypothetical protein
MIINMLFYTLHWPSRYDYVRRNADELHFSERIFVGPLPVAMMMFPFLVLALVIGVFAYRASLAAGPYVPPISDLIGYLIIGTGVLMVVSGMLSILGIIVVHVRGGKNHGF